jgi:hypothetical protein
MAQAMARYVRTATGPTSGTYGTGRTQGYFDTARKSSPFVVATTSGTPSVSSFQLKAAGVWEICTDAMFSSNATVSICRAGFAVANEIAASGQIVNPSCHVLREFDFNATIQIAWTILTTASTMTLRDDNNFVSFLYHGPL